MIDYISEPNNSLHKFSNFHSKFSLKDLLENYDNYYLADFLKEIHFFSIFRTAQFCLIVVK